MNKRSKSSGLLEMNSVSYLLQALDVAAAPPPERKPRTAAAWPRGGSLAFGAGCMAVLAISVLIL